jgi:hypothetical protein
MTSLLGAILLVAGVMVLIKASGLFARALQAVRASKGAFEVMRDPGLGDDRKELLLQGYSLSLLRSFLDLLMRGAGSIVIPVGILWVLELAGILSFKEVLDLTLSWPFLLVGALAVLPAFWFLAR